jgi:hypothetical protein
MKYKVGDRVIIVDAFTPARKCPELNGVRGTINEKFLNNYWHIKLDHVIQGPNILWVNPSFHISEFRRLDNQMYIQFSAEHVE